MPEINVNLECPKCGEVTVKVDNEDDSKMVECPKCNQELACGLSVKNN